jgi:hypothetical protein
MLNEALSYPPSPERAEMRPFPGFVLGSLKSSRYPIMGKSCLGSSRWAGEM